MTFFYDSFVLFCSPVCCVPICLFWLIQPLLIVSFYVLRLQVLLFLLRQTSETTGSKSPLPLCSKLLDTNCFRETNTVYASILLTFIHVFFVNLLVNYLYLFFLSFYLLLINHIDRLVFYLGGGSVGVNSTAWNGTRSVNKITSNTSRTSSKRFTKVTRTHGAAASTAITTTIQTCEWRAFLFDLRILQFHIFVPSFTHSFLNSFAHSFVRSFVRLFIFSFILSFIH